ncbi:PAS domain S-box protein [Zooshikella marina]|uniref:ATP-binding protein n=1 Tax=Zooshikella ganghwensis TaxID=202772 RepID=UPI001BB019FE|nr:ATP-binding protein [Zooshikella ganghwensis]MBU2708204.1 PAS domain S-box protein [Zooshikella ganghwensis]
MLTDLKTAEALLRRTVDKVESANQTLNHINSLQKKKDVNLLSYKFMQDDRFLKAVENASDETDKLLDQLQITLGDKKEISLFLQFSRIRDSNQSIQRKLIRSIEQSDVAKIESAFIQWKILSLKTEAILQDLTILNIKRVNEVVGEFNKLQSKLSIATGSMFAFLIFIVILSTIYYHRYIVRPIAKLSSKMDQFSLKKANSIDFVDSKDEISNLAKSFNKMAKELFHTTVSRDSLVKEVEHRRILEADLEEAKERIRLVVECESNALILVNESGIITMVNRQTEAIFGYDRNTLLGQPIEMLVPQDLREIHKSHFSYYQQAMNKRPMGKDKKVFGLHKKGSTIPIEVTLTPIQFTSGKSILASVTDISERLAAQQEKDNLIERLSQSNEELERFAYICSHDLQEPLRMVRSYSEKLQMKLGDSLLDEKASRYMFYVTDGAARAQELITDILTYSRLDAEERKEVISVEDIIANVSQNLQENINKTRAKIQHSQLPYLHANRTLIFQLFQNLISNALKYCEKQPFIEISFNWEDGWGVFSVKDNGIGIAPKYHSKIFKIFQRLHGKNEYSGTGIGLAICKKIVEQHGGKITVISEQGIGATFECSFPRNIVVNHQQKLKTPTSQLSSS